MLWLRLSYGPCQRKGQWFVHNCRWMLCWPHVLLTIREIFYLLKRWMTGNRKYSHLLAVTYSRYAVQVECLQSLAGVEATTNSIDGPSSGAQTNAVKWVFKRVSSWTMEQLKMNRRERKTRTNNCFLFVQSFIIYRSRSRRRLTAQSVVSLHLALLPIGITIINSINFKKKIIKCYSKS